MPSSMSSSSTLLNDRRTFSAPRPSGKNGVPGTTATPRAAALFVKPADSIAPGSVSHEKNPPSGRVQRDVVGHVPLERAEQPFAAPPVERA